MNSFPDHINVKNKDQFLLINYKRVESLFRQEIYETLLQRKDENEYIDLTTFSRKYCKNSTCMIDKISTKVRNELEYIGWKTKLSFGDTGLFIYSTENPPTSCW
jgi:hypothetical protein